MKEATKPCPSCWNDMSIYASRCPNCTSWVPGREPRESRDDQDIGAGILGTLGLVALVGLGVFLIKIVLSFVA